MNDALKKALEELRAAPPEVLRAALKEIIVTTSPDILTAAGVLMGNNEPLKRYIRMTTAEAITREEERIQKEVERSLTMGIKVKLVEVALTLESAKHVVKCLRLQRLAAKSRRDRLERVIDPAYRPQYLEAAAAYSTANSVMVHFIEELKNAGFEGDWLEYDEQEGAE